MNINFIIFIVIFLSIYSLVNFYVGIRIIQSLIYLHPAINKIVYWLIFWMLAEAYVIGRFSSRLLKTDVISNFLTYIGAYWLGALYYFVLLYFLVDILTFIGKHTGLLASIQNFRFIASCVVLVSVILLMIYGIWNARTPQITHYDLTIPKKAGDLRQLHIVAISDIHLGNLVNEKRLDKLVKEIQKINPDVVLLAGDVIDEDIKPFVEQNMKDTFLRLKIKYGVYASLGNHEYIGDHVEEAIHYMEEGGIKVLRDEYVLIENSFYVVGRDDRSRNRFSATPRKELSSLLEGIDKAYPILLLDHQPYKLDEVAKEGVDFQISGHTHNGQLFPNQLITAKIFEVDWGYLQKGNLHAIVSSGFGTWGPPIKVGSPSEIVDIVIHFK